MAEKDLYPKPWVLAAGIFVDDANGATVTLPQARMGDSGNKQLQKAAALLASAPDLYAALCQFEFTIEADEDCGVEDCEDCKPYRLVRSALAKARGE